MGFFIRLSPGPSLSMFISMKKKILFEAVDWRSFAPNPVVGVDEVGRGCLAGPVYAAAACLKSDELIQHFTDSKLISEKRREELSPLIKEHHWVSVGFATVEEIDELNILQASLLAMKRAVESLEVLMGQKAGHVLVDGNMKIPNLKTLQTTIVKGDLRCASISAASIVAKVTRDQLMKDLGLEHPVYGFEKHKGYASSLHRESIAKYGPIHAHRKSFAGVKEYL